MGKRLEASLAFLIFYDKFLQTFVLPHEEKFAVRLRLSFCIFVFICLLKLNAAFYIFLQFSLTTTTKIAGYAQNIIKTHWKFSVVNYLFRYICLHKDFGMSPVIKPA